MLLEQTFLITIWFVLVLHQLSGNLPNQWLISLRANWFFTEIKEKLSRAPLKWKAKTRWFSALILDHTQASMRRRQREKRCGSTLSILALTWLVNGTCLASFMVERI